MWMIVMALFVVYGYRWFLLMFWWKYPLEIPRVALESTPTFYLPLRYSSFRTIVLLGFTFDFLSSDHVPASVCLYMARALVGLFLFVRDIQVITYHSLEEGGESQIRYFPCLQRRF